MLMHVTLMILASALGVLVGSVLSSLLFDRPVERLAKAAWTDARRRRSL